MSRSYVGLFSLLACFTLFSLQSCTKRTTRVEEGNRTQVLHYGNGTEPQTIDPNMATGVPEASIMRALFEGLVNEDPKNLRPLPGVAESWKISKNQKRLTFFIRKNAKWSNGDPVTAADFVYGWKRLLSPGLASEYAYMIYPVKNSKAFNRGKIKDFSKVGVKALDAKTLQVDLENPTPYFLSLLTHASTYPIHQKTIEKHGKIDDRVSSWTRPENIVTNGPFRLKTWELNRILVVEKNPLYWDAEIVRLKEIRFYPTESSQTEERAFRAGQIHVTNTLPSNKIVAYREKKSKFLRIHPLMATYYYRINTRKKPFDDVRVRRAFSMSIDRRAIVDRVTKGGQVPAHNFTPPGTGGYTSRANIPYDIEGARKLLAEAGYPGGKGFPAVEIVYNTLEGHKLVAEAFQQMWKKALGVEVRMNNQDWKVFLNTVKSGDYSLARAGWNGDYNDPTTFLEMFLTDGGNNQTGWSNAQYDQYLAQAAKSVGEVRSEILQKAEELLIQGSPIIPIYTYTRAYLIQPSVKGYHPNIQDHHPWKWVYLQEGGT